MMPGMRGMLSHSIALPLRALLLAWVLAALPGIGWAQSQPQSQAQAQAPSQAAQDAAPLPDIADLRDQLAKLPTAADTPGDMRGLMSQIAAIGAQADKFIAARTGQLNDLNARLGELGNAPPPGTSEDPDITRQRALLTKERNAVDADVRLARLVVVDAQQRGNDLLNKRRELFEAQISERSASPLGRTFWHDLAEAWPDDIDRLQALGAEIEAGAARARQEAHRGPVLLTLALALLLITVGNLLAERGLVLLAQRLLPGGRLRRSLLVIAIVGANMLIVALALRASVSTFDAHGLLGTQTRELAKVLGNSLLFMTFVVSLGRALLANARPSWRLPPIPDPLAKRLRAFPLLAALTMVLVWVPAQINALIDASLAAVVATHVITALALTGLIAAMLLRLRGPKPHGAADGADNSGPVPLEGADAPPTAPAPHERPLWVAMLLGAITLVLIAIWVLVGMGYVALASLLAGQLMWTGIVVCAFYVLFKFADDLFMATVSARSGFGGRLQKSFGFAPPTLDQAAVVLSALSRVALFFYMVIALVAPLGTDPGEVFQRSGQFGAGVKIGEFQLVPSAIFSAIGVLVAGFIALRVARHWLQERYLPTTTLEAGMQSSLTTLLGYAGGILVVAIALSALGIGINRIAWIASALSVGIGFGLQAIVQNFISGLILLAERPVKVGDWVVLGTTEGDVRRINVRATEIALGDRSTVIVPNSEFITKTVRNMTLANAEGRVLIRLPMPLNTDAQKVRELMLAACSAHPGVLATPAPSLTLEGIESGQLIFQAIAYVPSPRLAGGVKSDLLFTMLEEFRKAGVVLAVPTMVMAAPLRSSSPAAGG
ncbi:Mechanosensitive channel MscK [Xylophilus ampelinus]|nr:Mechanosensitive channel MscK [Xylophilus ampelinus]